MLIQRKIEKVMTWVGGVEKQIRPSGWKPGENTLLYLPLKSDVVDKSGKSGRTFTTSGVSYTTVGGVQSFHVGTTGGIKLTAPYPLKDRYATEPCTVSVLVYVTTQKTSARRTLLDWGATGGNRIFMALEGNTTNIRGAIDYNNTGKEALPSPTIIANSRMHIVLVSTTSSIKLYLNGNKIGEVSPGWSTPRGYRPNSGDNTQGIFCTRDVNNYGSALNGNARELIMEDKEWSAEDVSKYYQQIKKELGI